MPEIQLMSLNFDGLLGDVKPDTILLVTAELKSFHFYVNWKDNWQRNYQRMTQMHTHACAYIKTSVSSYESITILF